MACVGALRHTVTTTVTTTVWVISGVHNNTTDTWALTLVAVTTGFTDLNVLVLLVADDTDDSRTFSVDQADFAAMVSEPGRSHFLWPSAGRCCQRYGPFGRRCQAAVR